MIDETKYENAMQIIACAGTSKSLALEAVGKAAEGDFDAASDLLAQARSQMASAHDVQFSMIASEASGSPVEVNIMLVHAEDHLTMAIMAIDMAEQMIGLYQRLAG